MNTKLQQKCQNYNFEKLFKQKGYAYFTNGNYNLNIIGIRNLTNGNIQDNTFELLYRDAHIFRHL